MSEDAITGRDVCTVCAAVIAGVRFYLSNEVVFILGNDRFSAPLADHADGHGLSVCIRAGSPGLSPAPCHSSGSGVSRNVHIVGFLGCHQVALVGSGGHFEASCAASVP